MFILGVCNAYDSGADLMVDEKIVSAVNEERFVRKKLTSEFPKNSIDWVLNCNALTNDMVDYLGCGAWEVIDSTTTLPHSIESIFSHLEYDSQYSKKLIQKRILSSIKSDLNAKNLLYEGLVKIGFNKENIIPCDHHYSHALTAYCCSPFKDALVFTADGREDFRSITLWKRVEGSELELLGFVTELDSPGYFYGAITKLLILIADLPRKFKKNKFIFIPLLKFYGLN